MAEPDAPSQVDSPLGAGPAAGGRAPSRRPLYATGTSSGIRIQYASVPVDDQVKAKTFYTEKLGFHVISDDPIVGKHRWLTVGSPDGVQGVELLLEPNALPAAQVYQKALYADGIPCATFMVGDMDKTLAFLKARDVTIKVGPVKAGPVIIAHIDDTCGNLLQLTQKVAAA